MDIKHKRNFKLYIWEAAKLTLRDGKLLTAFLIFWVLFFVGMFSVPLNAISGNNLAFQMMLFASRDYILLGFLSFLASLVIVIQIYIFREGFHSSRNVSGILLGGVGIVSGIVSSIFASATCALCIAALFSFLGFNAVFFLVDNRWYVLVGALVLLLASLYFSSKRLMDGCQSCVVETK